MLRGIVLNGTKHQPDWLYFLSGWSFYPEPSVKFHYDVSEVDPLSAANKASDLWMIVCPDVVTHKVPVEAVSASLLLVQQDVRSWKQKIP